MAQTVPEHAYRDYARYDEVNIIIGAAILAGLKAIVGVDPLDTPYEHEELADRMEKDLFNEGRLYDALGKEDARSVLAVWREHRRLTRLAVMAAQMPVVRLWG